MKYNFDEIIVRRNTASTKWDFTSDADIIPMWVADMDFKTAPAITKALLKRAESGVFGYSRPSAQYHMAIVNWFKKRHGLELQPGWILSTTGVVAALSAIIKALTKPGDKVLIQTPVYNCFFSSPANNGCLLSENPLIYQNNTYTIDFEDLEKKAADPSVKLMLLCNPHNPAGRVWSPEELRKIGEICFKHNVFVIADEIHCELIRPGFTYTPFASLGKEFLQNSVTCTSPSKAFNLAGLQAANIFVSDKEIKEKIAKALHSNEVSNIGPFGIDAVIAAYEEGTDWLDELNLYLDENYKELKTFFEKELPPFPVLPLEGTYLVWVDCSILKKSSTEISDLLLKEHIRINPGNMYGKNGDTFIRINIACPRKLMLEGLNRIKKGLKIVN